MELKFLLAIPVFDNPGTISDVVAKSLSRTEFFVLVVDDGSQIAVETLLAPHPRLTIFRHAKNEGKGVALQAAFDWALSRGFTHVVSLDGDGQHHPSDILKLTEKAQEHPWALVIGSRNLSQGSVPAISKFGRAFSNFWVNYETRIPVTDSQSGFRVYPLFQVQCLKLRRHRYDFEIEVLIRLMWKKVVVQEVPIDVTYFPPSERVSHFNKFSDNVRITFLNFALIFLSLLRSPQQPSQFGYALGAGVLIGCTPFFGLHAILAMPVAFLFRLNYLIVFMGTQISIPILAPLLAFSSLKMGAAFFPELALPAFSHFDLRQARALASVWLVGSLILGVILGTLTGLVAYAVARTARAKQSLWSGKSRGGTFGNWLIRTVTQRLGIDAGYFCLYFVVPYFYLFAPKARRASLQYWALMSPNSSRPARTILVLKHFFRFGQVLLDRLYQSYQQTPTFQYKAQGIQHIRIPVQESQAVLIVGAHAGGWDIAARYLEWDGVPGTFHPVQLQAKGVTFENNLKVKETNSVERLIVNRTQMPILEIREKLSQGKPVGLMSDRPTPQHAELILFLGKLAAFDGTPFRIAAATKTPLVMSLGFKSDRESYAFYAAPARQYEYEEGRSRGEQLRQWVQEFAIFLEGHLKNYPHQWFNFFEVWSSAPQAGMPASRVPMPN